VGGRIDGWVVDLGSFHPAEFSVVDGIRGLQYTNHNNNKPDQMLRNNLILAGEDAVAVDSVVAAITGFNPWDLEYLHMAARRDIGTMDSGKIEVVGDDPGSATRSWAKPGQWHGRCNREWSVTGNPSAPMVTWNRLTIPTDTLHLGDVAVQTNRETGYASAMRVRAAGSRKAFLWVGVHGRVSVTMNGNKIMEEESAAACHVGQFKVPVELNAGENLFEFRVRGILNAPEISALIVGPRNDGDTLDDIRYLA